VFENFLRSGHTFKDFDSEKMGRFQMINIALLFSLIGLTYGITVNYFRSVEGIIIPIEIALIISNFIFVVILRKYLSSLNIIIEIITAQYTVFFLYLFYFFGPEDMKFLWIYTYPVIILYFQKIKNGIYWLTFMLLMINIYSFQTFIEVKFSFYQVTYLSIVLLIVSSIFFFYKLKLSQASNTISKQRMSIQNKYSELSKKDRMLSTQSRQAVMGEMMSMIAHQWRQPLSNVTLQISNLQFDKLLGKNIDGEKLDNTLTQISNTLIYLSNTVDDFQTYFHPNKVKNEVEIHEVLQKAVNFVLPRTKSIEIDVKINKYFNIDVITYENELIQIILNLLNNAIDALKKSSNRDKKIFIDVGTNDEYLYISVVDNADGIFKNNIEKIFEPYFSTKGKNGTGLGLYMSKVITQKQFDGDITVNSSQAGSHFIVKIKKDVNF